MPPQLFGHYFNLFSLFFLFICFFLFKIHSLIPLCMFPYKTQETLPRTKSEEHLQTLIIFSSFLQAIYSYHQNTCRLIIILPTLSQIYLDIPLSQKHPVPLLKLGNPLQHPQHQIRNSKDLHMKDGVRM